MKGARGRDEVCGDGEGWWSCRICPTNQLFHRHQQLSFDRSLQLRHPWSCISTSLPMEGCRILWFQASFYPSRKCPLHDSLAAHIYWKIIICRKLTKKICIKVWEPEICPTLSMLSEASGVVIFLFLRGANFSCQEPGFLRLRKKFPQTSVEPRLLDQQWTALGSHELAS